MDSLPNAIFVLKGGRLFPLPITEEGKEYIEKVAIKRIGGPWFQGGKPPEACFILEREGQLPLEVYDVLILGCEGGDAY